MGPMPIVARIRALLWVLIIFGCASPVVHNTPSGKVEVTINGVNTDAVKARLVNEMLNIGYSITQDTPHVITFDAPVENALGAILYGSEYDSTPNARISYTLVQAAMATRVVADIAVITNPGSPFERRRDFNHGQDSPTFQTILDRIKSEMETHTSK